MFSPYLKNAENLGFPVIGTIIGKTGDYYRLNIFSPKQALLPTTAFNGGTKKHRPQLNVGDIVFCFITRETDSEFLLSCEDTGTLRDWSSGEPLFGCISTTTDTIVSRLLSVSFDHSKYLLKSINMLLTAASKHIKQGEVAVGINGKVFIKGASAKDVLFLSKVVEESIKLQNDEIQVYCKMLSNSLLV
jgi:exosome complex component RRP40